jgi:hypothetical protein
MQASGWLPAMASEETVTAVSASKAKADGRQSYFSDAFELNLKPKHVPSTVTL